MSIEQRVSEYLRSAGRHIPAPGRSLASMQKASARRLVRIRIARSVGVLAILAATAALTVGVLILFGF